MIPISEALEIIERETFPPEAETIVIEHSVGRVLAEEVFADTDLPPFDRSQMDGFALRRADAENAPARLRIVGESVAGRGFDGELRAGEAVRIMTGARVPRGADAVQKKELTHAAGGEWVEILEPVKVKQNIVGRAEEIKAGVKIFAPGERITPPMIAVLASFGYAKVKVFRRPGISILATGSEIVSVGEKPGRDQIRDSNSASLRAFATQTGADARVLPRTEDDLESLKRLVASAVGLETSRHTERGNARSSESEIRNPKSEILVLSGGVSVGDYDFTKPALRALGAEIFFEKVALRPGKPTVFARLNDCLVFGLPGNPVSVAVTFFLFVRRAILRTQGAADAGLREGFAVLTKNVKGSAGRDSYLPGKINFGGQAQIAVEPVKWGGSSDFVSFSKADCLIFVPQNESAAAGEVAKILFLP